MGFVVLGGSRLTPTFFWWWIILVAILWSILEWLGEWWKDGNGHERFASVAILLTVTLGAFAGINQYLRRKWYRRNLFRLIVCKSIPIGNSSLVVEVAVGSESHVGDFDLRFTQTKRGVNTDRDIIKITSALDKSRNLRFFLPGGTGMGDNVRTWAELNEAGGIDCHYTPPIFIRAKRSLFLVIGVNASKPWSGWLSFRGSDKWDKETFARAQVSVCPQALDAQDSQN